MDKYATSRIGMGVMRMKINRNMLDGLGACKESLLLFSTIHGIYSVDLSRVLQDIRDHREEISKGTAPWVWRRWTVWILFRVVPTVDRKVALLPFLDRIVVGDSIGTVESRWRVDITASDVEFLESCKKFVSSYRDRTSISSLESILRDGWKKVHGSSKEDRWNKCCDINNLLRDLVSAEEDLLQGSCDMDSMFPLYASLYATVAAEPLVDLFAESVCSYISSKEV